MFKSFKDSLTEVERLYDNKDYNATILESAKLTELAISLFFNHFHTFLNSKEEWQRYLQFEQQAGDKYAAFLKKPTIGVAIGYYNSLLELFPNQTGIDQEIRQHLNTINSIRNSHLHSNQKNATADDAGRILDALEKILNRTNLTRVSTTAIGVPIKYYLVFSSIREKFEVAESESDFRNIVDDSLKIMPALLSILLNKVYYSLSTSKKGELVDMFISSVDRKSENELGYYLNLCNVIEFEKLFPQGASLSESIKSISISNQDYSRRQSRHYVNILEIIAEYSNNPATKHFLDFADAVKKRYLVKHKFDDKDRIILEEKARDLRISNDLANRIEESVVSTIEKELILFKTLTAGKGIGEPARITTNDRQKGLSRKKVMAYSFLGLIPVVAFLYFWLSEANSFTNYERAYFEDRLEDAEETSRSARTLSDVKSHFYYLLSVSDNNTTFPEAVKFEYRDLLKKNPKSPEAHFYLGLAFYLGTRWNEEADSAFMLMDYARKNGVAGFESDYMEAVTSRNLGQSQAHLALCKKLLNYNNPRGLGIAANAQLGIAYDTALAKELFNRALELYPGYMRGYFTLSAIAIKQRKFTEARELLTKARKINPESVDVISRLARLHKEEGDFAAAKALYRDAIESFGNEKKDLYYGLLDILLQEDSIASGLSFVNRSFEKFPKDMVLLNFEGQFKRRERWLKEEQEINKEKNLLPWVIDFEKAKEQSRLTGKPILVDFYTSWCYWCKVLDKKVYPDSTVQLNLEKYVLLKINAEREPKIAGQYEVNAFPTLLVLDEAGTKLYQLNKYVSPVEINNSLKEGLKAFADFEEGKKVTREKFTLVSNLNDAKIISKTKNVPIMLLVGDKRSTWSEKLLKSTIDDPAFKKEFTQIVYLPVDKLEAPDFLKNYNISNYPTILFLDDEGKEFFRITGYRPAKVLQEKVNVVKASYKKSKIEAGINWYYDLEEAKANALMQKRNIFIAGFDPLCDPCNWMETGTYAEQEIIDLLNEKYVCLHLEKKVDREVISQLGIEIFPAQLILNESGSEMFRSDGAKDAAELKGWLDIDERLKILGILGPDRFKKFNEDFAVAKALADNGNWQSALNLLQPLAELLPDHYEIHHRMGDCYSGLKRFEEAVASYRTAISKGEPISDSMLESILPDLMSAGKLETARTWFDEAVPPDKLSKAVQAQLAHIVSKAHQYAGNTAAALTEAKRSNDLDPAYFNGQLQYGRLLYDNGSYDQAERMLKKANDTDKTNPVASFYLGLIAQKKGQGSLRKKYFDEATNRSSWAANQVSHNEIASIDNYYNYPASIDLLIAGYDNFIRLQQDESFPHYLKSVHMLLYKKDPGVALSEIDKAMEVNPEAVFHKFVKAWILYEDGWKDESYALVEEANKSFSDEDYFPVSDLMLGIYYRDKGEKDKATFHFKRASSFRNNVAWFKPIQSLASEKLRSI